MALVILMIEKLAQVQTSKHISSAADSASGYKAAANVHIQVSQPLDKTLAPLTEGWNLAERRDFVDRVRQMISEHENGRRLSRAQGYAPDIFGRESRF